ncbi:MAG: adenosine deaminase [Terracidiphilus sp.]
MDLRSLPKIELHLHLDCSLSYKAVSRLAPGVTLSEYKRDYVAPARCTNLADFLSRAPMGFRLMQSEDSLRVVTEDLFEQLAEDGVIYAEIRFAPLLHTLNGLCPERVCEVVERAIEDQSRASGIDARAILCTLRHFSAAESMHTAELVEKFRGSRVAALDIAGDEAGFPLDAHVGAYRFARERGLFRTAHAGEACGPESVWETLRLLDPQRIGHGTRSHEDAKLVDYLRTHGIHLELCPSSNVQIISSIESWRDHPIDRLYRAGISLSVSTDTRMLTPTTQTGEYEGLRRTFGRSEEDFFSTNLMGLDAAFVEAPVRERIKERLAESYGTLARPV